MASERFAVNLEKTMLFKIFIIAEFYIIPRVKIRIAGNEIIQNAREAGFYYPQR
jgi:hypothetical protein